MRQVDAFPKELKRARQRAGLTQEHLADMAGKARTDINRYEAGRGQPDLKSFAALADALGVSADVLLGRVVL